MVYCLLTTTRPRIRKSRTGTTTTTTTTTTTPTTTTTTISTVTTASILTEKSTNKSLQTSEVAEKSVDKNFKSDRSECQHKLPVVKHRGEECREKGSNIKWQRRVSTQAFQASDIAKKSVDKTLKNTKTTKQ